MNIVKEAHTALKCFENGEIFLSFNTLRFYILFSEWVFPKLISCNFFNVFSNMVLDRQPKTNNAEI